MPIGTQLIWLFVLAAPVAAIARTVTNEEVFREPRDYCAKRSRDGKTIWERKFFYLFTCDYCFSHWVSLAFIIMMDFTLLVDDWRGYVIALFALVWVANVYSTIFAHLRLDIKKERAEIEATEATTEKIKNGD
jgi:hypothetical protein